MVKPNFKKLELFFSKIKIFFLNVEIFFPRAKPGTSASCFIKKKLLKMWGKMLKRFDFELNWIKIFASEFYSVVQNRIV